MSTSSASSSISNALSLVAAFDDINRLNNVLNDGYGEECFLRFARQQEWCRMQWASALGETVRLQHELDDALRALTTWEAKFANARKLLDAEKKQRRLAVEKCEALEKQMALARDLLFNDNRNKLNNETLEKLAFLNATTRSTAAEHNQPGTKLNAIPEMNSTGTVLSDVSYSRSEDDLDLSIVSGRRSWVKTRNSMARSPHGTSPGQQDAMPTVKKRRSSSSSATKVVEIEGAGRVLATATTTLTLERAVPGDGNNKPPSFGRDATSESSDEQQTPQSHLGRCVQSKQTLRSQISDYPPSAPPRTDTESASDVVNSPRKQLATRPSLRQEPWGSPRARLRAHSFVNKTYFCAETCRPCGKKIKFAKIGVRCETCRATCHAECRSLLPLPCVPPGTATHNQNTQCSIADYAPSTPPMVPALLVHCINEVEKRGLSEQGLYRKSGADKDVKRLKEKFLRNHGSPPLADEDLHTLCSCIKDFIRGLNEPLVTRSLWNDFMEAAQISEPGDAAAAIIQATSQLPQPNRDTLAFLVLHLQKVAESPDCQMPIGNLSKVFGPTVLNYADAPEKDMYKLTANQLLVMELILRLPSEYWVQFVGAGELCSSPYMTPQATPRATPATNNRNDGLHHSRGYFYSPVQATLTRKPRKYFA